MSERHIAALVVVFGILPSSLHKSQAFALRS
jgi:hypothetical protein